MTLKKNIFISVIIFGLPLALAMGDMGSNHWKLMVQPGISLPGGNSNELENESFSIQESIERKIRSNLSVGVEAGNDFGHRLDGTLFSDVDHDGITEALKAQSQQDAQLSRAGLFLKLGTTRDWGTWDTRWVDRFFIFGCGLYHYAVSPGEYILTGQSSTGQIWDGSTYPIQKESSDHLGINLGVGFDVSVFKYGTIGFDIRFHQFFRYGKDGQYWIPSLKFGIVF